MNLKSGFRFMVAPRFHISGEWSPRLLIGSGVQEINGIFIPRLTWRPASTEELSMLIADSSKSESLDAARECINLFQLPQHLGSEWWNLLESSAGAISAGQLPGFDSFVARVGEFLAFKGFTLPDDADFNLVVSKAAVRAGSDAGLLGWVELARERPWADGNPLPRDWGTINLGDEETSVVLINLPLGKMAEELLGRFPLEPVPATIGELAARFLGSFPDYPTVRLILQPGQGFCLPKRAVVLGGFPVSNADPELLLTISGGLQVSR